MAKEATLQVRMDAELKYVFLPNKVCLRMACLLSFRQIEAVLMAALPNMQII